MEIYQLKLHIYFDLLSFNQRKKLEKLLIQLGYMGHHDLQYLTVSEFSKITKSKKTIDALCRLKRMYIKVA